MSQFCITSYRTYLMRFYLGIPKTAAQIITKNFDFKYHRKSFIIYNKSLTPFSDKLSML
jgi:hypothetical protein